MVLAAPPIRKENATEIGISTVIVKGIEIEAESETVTGTMRGREKDVETASEVDTGMMTRIDDEMSVTDIQTEEIVIALAAVPDPGGFLAAMQVLNFLIIIPLCQLANWPFMSHTRPTGEILNLMLNRSFYGFSWLIKVKNI